MKRDIEKREAMMNTESNLLKLINEIGLGDKDFCSIYRTKSDEGVAYDVHLGDKGCFRIEIDLRRNKTFYCYSEIYDGYENLKVDKDSALLCLNEILKLEQKKKDKLDILTAFQKLGALTRIKRYYEWGQDFYLDGCAMSAYAREDISRNLRKWFEGLLDEEARKRGISDRWSIWLINDKESRLKWLDEQIKMVENGEI